MYVLDEDFSQRTDYKEYWKIDSIELTAQLAESSEDTLAESIKMLHMHKHSRHHLNYSNIYELDFKDQRILLPGITGKHMVVINLLQRNSISGGYVFLGQCCLHFNKVWRFGGSLSMPLQFTEYSPRPEIDPETRKEIPIDYTNFIELMHVAQEYHRRLLKNTFDINSSSDHLTASERANGFLQFSVEVKAGTHATCGFMEVSDPEKLKIYMKACPSAKCILSSLAQPSVLSPSIKVIGKEVVKKSRHSNDHIQIAPKKCWVAIADEYFYVYESIGGELAYILNLRYMNIELKDIKRVPGMIFRRVSSDKGADRLPYITAIAPTKKECGNWKFACFAAKRCNINKEVDYNMVFTDIDQAKALKLRRERKKEDILGDMSTKGKMDHQNSNKSGGAASVSGSGGGTTLSKASQLPKI